MTEGLARARFGREMDEGRQLPIMRSVVHRKHAAIGAVFESRGAWSVPALYGSVDQEIAALDAMLGFADISARGKLQLSGAVDDYLQTLTGGALEPLHTASIPSGGTVARIAPDWALALFAPSTEGKVIRALDQQRSAGAMATDVTGALSGFLVAGPRLEDFLARTITIDPADVRSGRCVTASWARIPATLVMKDLREPAIEIYVSSDHGRYAWEVLQRLAGTPVGWQALEAWGWR
jgi:glycine cleavage system aminomethyltransferase T